jgi:magnesium chelatase family protein
VLFLDELAEYPRAVLDALREPLESRRVSLARGRWHVTFPAECQFLAAMNPCPCGYFPDLQRCRCGEAVARRYLGRLSGPFLDRMDLQVALEPKVLGRQEVAGGVPSTLSEPSAQVRERVLLARERQAARGTLNAQLSVGQLRDFAPLDPPATELLDQAAARRGMSARACHRALRVARTVADLADRAKVTKEDLGVALQLRQLETWLTPKPATGVTGWAPPITSR